MLAFLRKLRLPKSRQGRIAVLVAAIPVALFLLAFITFGVDRVLHSGEVLRGVEFAGENLEGLDEEGVRDVVAGFEDDLMSAPALFTVNDREFALDPQTIGFALDDDAVVAEAMAIGREKGPFTQFGDWIGSFGSERQIGYSTEFDAQSLALVFDQWESDAIEVGVSDGSISARGTEIIVEYPQRGLAIDRAVASELVGETLASSVRQVAIVPLTILEPSLLAADIDAAAEEAEILIASSVVLSKGGVDDLSAVFTSAQLASALRSEVTGSPARLDLWFEPAVIDGFLAPLREGLELPPRDAEFVINDDDTVTLVPSRPGTLLDPEQVAEALAVAAKTPSRRGELPIVDGAEPGFTTEEAEALGPITKVSEFTTNHACCEGRVTNIQLFSDLVDGIIVQPGETFSLNEAVGRRTTDKGFVSAPMIREGELVPDVGGGVSQFATTFYNAVFFGGYEDIEHTPHSIYISRYPELREATISWPEPGLIFRNDSDSIIIIDTSHTDTSITVKFFGNNGGRTVEWELGGRFNFRDPEEVFESNPAIVPGEQHIRRNGSSGWSISGTQTITYPDGTTVERKYSHRYRGAVRFIEVHPCEMPNSTEICPVQVPVLVGNSFDAAAGVVAGLGLGIVNGGTTEVAADSGLVTLVVSQSPASGELVPPGTAITVLIGVASPTTTTTTTPPTTTTTTPPPTTIP
ncbi:MAG: VanW family protein [Acidimicrobiia bacterium]|nr:VanW family protein [Acidimicrobiia bacterium]